MIVMLSIATHAHVSITDSDIRLPEFSGKILTTNQQ